MASTGVLSRPGDASSPEPGPPILRTRPLPRPTLRQRMPADRAMSWVWAVVITVIAGVLRLQGLSSPNAKIFDEVYYAKDSHDLITHAVERNGTENGPGFVVHPPLAKWTIGLGEWLFGYNSFGWRISAAVIGTLAVLLLIRITRRMTRSTLLGCVAGLLLALDGLEFVQSRVALLDIFVMFWLLAAFGCLVCDRDDFRRRLARARRTRDLSAGSGALGVRWWLWGAIVCLAAAWASKWTGMFYIPFFAVMVLCWDIGARRTAGIDRPFVDTIARTWVGWIGRFVLVVVLYAASWTGWFLTRDGWNRNWAATQPGLHGWGINALRGWWNYQHQIYEFDVHLHAYHPYMSLPWSWLIIGRPVAYYYTAKAGCGSPPCASEVLAIGTPALWWLFIPTLIGVSWLWLSRRDWRGAAVLVGVGACFLPLLPYPDRTMFYFYALPALPFLVIGLTLCLGMVLGPPGASPERRVVGTSIVATYVAVVAICFAFFHPILVGAHLDYSQWKDRIWFSKWI